MGTRITGGDKSPRNPHDMYPEIEIGCLNRAHPDIVHFKIPRGRKTAKCPQCGRKAGRD